jgi:hypothetical protein
MERVAELRNRKNLPTLKIKESHSLVMELCAAMGKDRPLRSCKAEKDKDGKKQ